MKLLLGFTVLSFSLSLCRAACFLDPFENNENRDACIDSFDGTKHPVGSEWNTAQCSQCWCYEEGMQCCHRYGGVVEVKGCTAVVDPETCEYKFYKKDDPSEPCFP